MLRDRLVVVFARSPRDERRAKPLVAAAPAAAVETLHDRLLRRTLAVARASGAPIRLVTTGEVDASAFGGDVEITRQGGGSFGERLERAVAGAFASGWRHVVVIGADTPGLEARHLARAFAELEAAPRPRAVVGPARDGGYYLLALNAFAAAPFRGVPFCTPAACAATVAALGRAGFAVATLPVLRDVDGGDDLAWLCRRGGRLAVLARAALTARRWPRLRLPGPIASHASAQIRSRGPPALA